LNRRSQAPRACGLARLSHTLDDRRRDGCRIDVSLSRQTTRPGGCRHRALRLHEGFMTGRGSTALNTARPGTRRGIGGSRRIAREQFEPLTQAVHRSHVPVRHSQAGLIVTTVPLWQVPSRHLPERRGGRPRCSRGRDFFFRDGSRRGVTHSARCGRGIPGVRGGSPGSGGPSAAARIGWAGRRSRHSVR
jgi:hypothetical protein